VTESMLKTRRDRVGPPGALAAAMGKSGDNGGAGVCNKRAAGRDFAPGLTKSNGQAVYIGGVPKPPPLSRTRERWLMDALGHK